MRDMRDLQAIAVKLERAMEQLRQVRFCEISAVGSGQVLDARCLLAEALGRLDSVRKRETA
jgi:hypothetical protein